MTNSVFNVTRTLKGTAIRFLVVLALLILQAHPAVSADISHVNDWGSGFIATYEHEVTLEDTSSGLVKEWRINLDYLGNANLINAWMSGYNGSISFGGANGAFQITNEGAGYVPDTSVGTTLTFSVQGQGSGFDASEFDVSFVNLDQTGNENPPSGGMGTFDASFVSVNDWFNPAWGGGFNATFECQVTSATPVSGFIAEFNYIGNGTPTSAWTQSYNGSIESGYIGNTGSYAVASAPSGYVPTLNNKILFES